jgi:tetratricopeptide (TPR) repeat protein
MRSQVLTALFLLAVFLAGASGSGRVALAQADDARAVALGLAREGAQLYERGDFQGALDKFEQAYAHFPSPKLLFNLGQAQRGLSRHAEALANFERFLAEAKDAGSDYRERAAIQIAELETKVTRVAVACNRPGSLVDIDGVKRGTIPLDKPLAVEPGAHRLSLVWKSEIRTVEFTAVAGQVLPLVLSFEDELRPPEGQALLPKAEVQLVLPAETPAAATTKPSSSRHIWYWVAGGAVVAVATALILVYTTRDTYPSADLGTRTIGGP